MHLTEKMLEPLKAHLVKTLTPISSAEPDVLATYIIALLKNDKDTDELKEQCISNLTDFLKDDTKPFVEKLFTYLKNLESGNGAEVDSSHYAEEAQPEQSFRRQTEESNSQSGNAPYDSYENATMAIATFDGSGGQQRRRGMGSNPSGGQANKRHRASSPTAAVPLNSAKQRCRDYDEQGFCIRGDACPFSHPDGIRVEDVNEMQRLNPMQGYVPSMAHMYGADSAGGGDTSVALVGPGVIPRFEVPGGQWLGARSGGYSGDGQDRGGRRGRGGRGRGRGGYGHSNSNYGHGGGGGYSSGGGYTYEQHIMSHLQQNPQLMQQPDASVELGGAGGMPISMGGAMAPPPVALSGASTDTQSRLTAPLGGQRQRQQRDPNTSTLSIVNIPRESNTIEGLSAHFKKFGTVVNIQIHLRNNRAAVQFAEHNEALAALRSPEAVLGNRFIKVLWANKDEVTDAGAGASSAGGAADAPASSTPSTTSAPKAAAAAAAPAPAAQGPGWNKLSHKAPAPAPAAASSSSSAAAAAAAEKARLQLQKTKEELRKAQLEQQKKLLDTLSKLGPNINPKDRADLLARLQSVTEALESSVKKDTSALVKKQQQLTSAASSAPPVVAAPSIGPSPSKRKELLDRELESISSGGDQSSSPISPAPYSYRGRGRGRGGPRGGRGRGSAAMWSMNLDNRPSSLVVQDVPEELRSGDQLQTHFSTFGTVTSSHFDGNNFTVQYSNRREAEQAIARGRSVGAHTLKLAWSSSAGRPQAEQHTAEDTETAAAEAETSASLSGATATAQDTATESVAPAGEYTHYAEEPEDEDRSWKRQ